MPPTKPKPRKITLVLVSFLLVEAAMVVSLRTLGWFGTGSAISLIACIFVTILPLLLAVVLLVRNRLRFGLRSLMGIVALFAVFLFVSAIPLIDYRSARTASSQLVAANATLNADLDGWDDFYTDMGLEPPPDLTPVQAAEVPPWLGPFTERLSAFAADESVRSIWLDSDGQIQILAEHAARFPNLQCISITSGVTEDGLGQLGATLARFTHLYRVDVNNVVVPENWYQSLTNIKTLFVWAEGSLRGTPFPSDDLADIASLPQLEVLMVLGYAFDDSDAGALASSRSIKRVILRGTAVTQAGESYLEKAMPDCIVRRN